MHIKLYCVWAAAQCCSSFRRNEEVLRLKAFIYKETILYEVQTRRRFCLLLRLDSDSEQASVPLHHVPSCCSPAHATTHRKCLLVAMASSFSVAMTPCLFSTLLWWHTWTVMCVLHQHSHNPLLSASKELKHQRLSGTSDKQNFESGG